jgi:hypothetical protein
MCHVFHGLMKHVSEKAEYESGWLVVQMRVSAGSAVLAVLQSVARSARRRVAAVPSRCYCT